MPRTIAALYDNRGSADAALQALLEAGLAGHQSALLACKESRASELAPRRTLSPDEGHFRATLRALGLPEGDSAELEEAVRRGGCVLTVRVDGATIERAVEILEAFEPADLDRRAAEWRKGGWRPGAAAVGAPLGADLAAGAGAGLSNTEALPGMRGVAGAADDLGTAQMRTPEHGRLDAGSSATATGARLGDARADMPGVRELAYRRDTDRTGRVRAYSR